MHNSNGYMTNMRTEQVHTTLLTPIDKSIQQSSMHVPKPAACKYKNKKKMKKIG
jgi:hypothetical protein